MLILVGVTVNVALTGGLFTKASEASKQMQVEAEKEELLSSVVAAIGYDGKVDLGEIELPTGWKGTNGTYTSPKGNTYTVDENGKIESGETKPVEPPTLELVQIDQGTYTDHTLIGLNVTFSSFEQFLPIVEMIYLDSIYEDGYPETFEGYVIEVVNEETEGNYATIKEIEEEYGLTYEEIVEMVMIDEEDWENWVIDAIKMVGMRIEVKQPNGTEKTFEEVKTYRESEELEGIYYYQSLDDLICGGNCYSATQTGTYEITLSFMDYEITDTITIENF